jgi:CheY-like chemotaxis protein
MVSMLVVDHDEQPRRLLRRWLEKWGFAASVRPTQTRRRIERQ